MYHSTEIEVEDGDRFTVRPSVRRAWTTIAIGPPAGFCDVALFKMPNDRIPELIALLQARLGLVERGAQQREPSNVVRVRTRPALVAAVVGDAPEPPEAA